MAKHRKAPAGARSAYTAPPLDEMQAHLDGLAVALERHATVNAEMRGEVYSLREINAELLAALKGAEAFIPLLLNDKSRDPQALKAIRAVIAKAEAND